MSVSVGRGSSGAPLAIEEVRTRQVRLLEAVVRHCEELDLRVYLAAGSLLGAVRHRGFIPWDDDVDVMLPRDDFERFCATFPRRSPLISLRAPGTTRGYPLPFAKVCDDETVLDVESDMVSGLGVFVDVFPLDGWHDRAPVRALQRMTLLGVAQAFRVKHLSLERKRPGVRNQVLWMAKRLLAPAPAPRLAKLATRAARLGRFDHCRRAGILVWGYRESVPRCAYGRAQALEFEGARFPAPAEPDTILRILYGDWRELPPVHQRVTHHRFTAYRSPS